MEADIRGLHFIVILCDLALRIVLFAVNVKTSLISIVNECYRADDLPEEIMKLKLKYFSFDITGF